jgi:endonuclease YncB( thermonuclease family)
MAAMIHNQLSALMLAASFLIAAPVAAYDGDTITGSAYAKDGDTLQINAESVRLYGIDAPEKKQTCEESGRTSPCGKKAAEMLGEIIKGEIITCTRKPGSDRYGRMLARCVTAGGKDIGGAMVSAGYALAYTKYSGDYVAIESEARKAKRGLWHENFVASWKWRQQN